MESPVKEFAKKYSTPLVMAASALVFLSGLYMLLIEKTHAIEKTHMTVGVIFIVASILHTIRNSAAFEKHIKRRAFHLLATATALVAVGSFYFAANSGHVSHKTIIEKSFDSSVENLAAVFKIPPEEALRRMRSHGVGEVDSYATLREIAKKNKINPRDLLTLFLTPDQN